MSNDPDSGTPERAKRTPPTIDLDPSEVTVTKDAAEANGETVQGAKPDVAKEREQAGRDQSARERKASENERRPWSDNASNALTPALSGATAAALILTGAWLLGLSGDNRTPAAVPMTVPVADGSATANLTARLAKLEADVAAKLNAPVPMPVAADPALATRIDQAEASIKSVTESLAALRADVGNVSAAVKDATASPREGQAQASSFDAASLEQRMAQIETTQRALTQALQQAAKPFDDAPLRRALVASALDTGVRSGEPFADRLAAVKAMTPAAPLQALDGFATSGVPSDAALARELIALLPQLGPAQPKPATTTSTASGILDRLQESASKLVKVERAEQQPSAEQSASTAKIAATARNGDVIAAKAALMELPPAQRAPAQGWLDRVQARDAARDTARQFAASQIAALPVQR